MWVGREGFPLPPLPVMGGDPETQQSWQVTKNDTSARERYFASATFYNISHLGAKTTQNARKTICLLLHPPRHLDLMCGFGDLEILQGLP